MAHGDRRHSIRVGRKQGGERMSVGVGRKFIFRGAFDRKKSAVRKERSAKCHKRGKKVCFILRRKIRGHKRYVVLERK
jgi:predicted GIY-YIG superfamily endonuclease